jgi:hypothetical protein
LFENYFPKIYEFIQINKLKSFDFSDNYVMKNLLSLFDAILPQFDFEEKKLGRRNLNTISKIDIIKKYTLSIFIFCCAWTVSFFTNYILKNKIEKLISDIFKADDLKGPIFDYYIDEEKQDFELWADILDYKTNNNRSSLLQVQNIEKISYEWICEKYIKEEKPIFYTGKQGVGKSLILNSVLNELDVKYYFLI